MTEQLSQSQILERTQQWLREQGRLLLQVHFRTRSKAQELADKNMGLPCAFCASRLPVDASVLKSHLKSCRPHFFQSNPMAENMLPYQLYELAWRTARQTALPEEYVRVRPALVAAAASRRPSSFGRSSSYEDASSKRPRTPTIGSTLPSAQRFRPEASPSQGPIPAPVQAQRQQESMFSQIAFYDSWKPQDPPEIKPLTYRVVKELWDESRLAPEFDQQDLDEALLRYNETNHTMSELFDFSSESRQDEPSIDDAEFNRLLALRDLAYSRVKADYKSFHRTIEENLKKKNQTVTEFQAALGSLMIVNNRQELETVALQYSLSYGSDWRVWRIGAYPRPKSTEQAKVDVELLNNASINLVQL